MLKEAKKYLEDSRGNKIPLNSIKQSDRKKHRVVETVFNRINLLEKKLNGEKEKINGIVDDYFSYHTQISHSGIRRQGSFTLTNNSGTRQIVVKSSNVIEFDQKIMFAINKIKSCLAKWGADSHPNLNMIRKRENHKQSWKTKKLNIGSL